MASIISPPVQPGLVRPRGLPPFDKNPVYQQQPIAPIHLSGYTQLQPGASGAVSAATLKNPMGQDMELLEVKFEVICPADGLSSLALGGTVGCELVMGAHKITNGAVPVWCFGKAENLSAESQLEDVNEDNLTYAYNMFSWRLPRPMFIPAGAALLPKFNHFGFIPNTLIVRVGYSARVVVKPPSTVCLPWVAAYMSKAFNPINVASSDQSPTNSLFNSTNRVFRLQRFVGRLQFADQAGTALDESNPESLGSRYLTVRMIDSYGRPIVRTYTPFRSVFGALTRSWELEDVGAQLDPGGFYQVFLKKEVMTMAAANNGGQAQAHVSMVGWREEPMGGGTP